MTGFYSGIEILFLALSYILPFSRKTDVKLKFKIVNVPFRFTALGFCQTNLSILNMKKQ